MRTKHGHFILKNGLYVFTATGAKFQQQQFPNLWSVDEPEHAVAHKASCLSSRPDTFLKDMWDLLLVLSLYVFGAISAAISAAVKLSITSTSDANLTPVPRSRGDSLS
jgi:hypothetical protein